MTEIIYQKISDISATAVPFFDLKTLYTLWGKKNCTVLFLQ